jgi:K+-sensing histidine kinase KdpD
MILSELIEKVSAENPRVLVVDDSEQNCKMVELFFSSLNVLIDSAYGASEALASIRNNKPNLILMDASMPGMNGYELCELIKNNEETSDIPVVFLTAKSNAEDITKGFESGGVDYIAKPFNPSELIARVFTQLEISFTRKKLAEQNSELKQTQKLLYDEAIKAVQMNEALYDSELKLKKINAAKDKLFSIVAHDLKSPLSSLKSQISLMNDFAADFTKEDFVDSLGLMKKYSDSVFKLLENLLLWSRCQLGSIKYEPDYYDAMIPIREIVSSINKKYNDRVVVNAPDTLNLFCDINMFDYVLISLLDNAIQFSPESSRIFLNIDKNIENNNVCEFHILDSGIGISEALKNKIFQLSCDENSNNSVGLSLIICKYFVDLHDSYIDCKDNTPVGADFFFAMPTSKTN